MTRAFEYRGAHRSIREIARMVGMKPSTLHFRLISKGMSVAEAIATPITPKHKLHEWGTRQARLYEFRGQMLSVYDIAPILGVHPETVRRRAIGNRIAEGEDLKDQHQEPPAHALILTFRGQSLTAAEWARRTGIDRMTLYSRLACGWTIKRALTEPPMRGDQRNIYRANRRALTRMVASFRALDPQPNRPSDHHRDLHPGGYPETSTGGLLTGGGRRFPDLQSLQCNKIHDGGLNADPHR